MNKLMIGNVIKTKEGNIEIVTGTSDDYTRTVSAEYSNSSAGYPTEDVGERGSCICLDGCGHPQSDCVHCGGTGEVTQIRYGSNSAEVLAKTVKEYILNGLKKNFHF
ncbi:MAG: hypothetical protein LLG05_05275 [Porphyromonadaceae bacterium]|nr:hypothetical protein [Porphyromonadaceae bacterium]